MVSFYESDPGYGDDQVLFSSVVIDNNKIWTLARTPGSETLLIPVSTTEAIVGKWIHLTTTFNKLDGTMKVYIDGQLAQEGAIDPFADYSDNGSLFIGANKYGTMVGHFDGLIDDVRIYNRTLSGIEVSDLHAEENPTVDGFPFGGLTWKAYEDGAPWRELEDYEYGHDETTVWLSSPTDVASHMINSNENFPEQDMTWEAKMWLEGNFNWQSFPFVVKSPFCRIFYYNYSKKWYVDTYDANGVRVEHTLSVPQPSPGVHYYWKCSYATTTGETTVWYRPEGGTYQEVFRGPTNWGGEMRLSDGNLHVTTNFNFRMNDGVGKTYYRFALLEEEANGEDPLLKSLLAYYDFDSNFLDTSGNGNTASNHGTSFVQDRFGSSNQAVSFDGVDDWVDLFEPGFLSEWTIGLWYKVDSYPSIGPDIDDSSVLISYSPPGEYAGYSSMISLNRTEQGVQGLFGLRDWISYPQIDLGSWHHVALTFNHAEHFGQFYFDGELVGEKTADPVQDSSHWLRIFLGASAYWFTPHAFFHGAMDEVAVFDRVLSQPEINSIKGGMLKSKSCNDPAFTDGLAIHFPFDAQQPMSELVSGLAADAGDSQFVTEGLGSGAILATRGMTPMTFVPDASQDFMGDLTLSAWIKPESVDESFQPIIVKSQPGASSFRLNLRGAGFGLDQGTTLARSEVTGNYLTAGEWSHLVVTRQGNGLAPNSIRFYLDGQFIGSDQCNEPPQYTANPIQIGERLGNQGAAMDGLIDEVKIFTRVLNDEEILGLHQCAPSMNQPDPDCTDSLTQGLLVHYPLDGTGNDAATNHLDGVVHNAIPAMDRFGNPNGAMYFDGDGDYVQIENHASLNNHTQMTMSAWINTSTSYDWAGHIIAKGSDYNYQYGMVVHQEGWARGFAWYSGGASHLVAQSPFTVTDSQWHHITTTLDQGNEANLYVDGQLVATGTNNGWSWNLNGPAPLFLGGVINGYVVRGFYEGLMDDVRIYDRVLDTCEIETLANDTGTTCYSDDFSTDLANWNAYGSWQIENGELVGNYSQNCGSPGCPQADLILKPEFQVNGDLKASVDFIKTKYRGSYNYHRAVANFSIWNTSNQRIAIQIGGGGDGDWGGQLNSLSVYTQTNNGNWQGYDYVVLPISWNTDVWNTASIIRQGNQYLIEFNGQMIHSFTDGFLNGQGDVGLHIYGTQRYDNFELCSLGTETPNNPPIVACKDITISLDALGNATVTANDLDNGSTDPDGDIITLSLSQEYFDCTHIGTQLVTLTATDPQGLSDSCVANVTVLDTLPPNIITQNIAIGIGPNGQASINASAVDNGTGDACGIATLTVTPSQFNCANVGDNIVTLTAVDVNGNSSSSTAIVTVVDSTPPLASANDIVLTLDNQGSVLLTPAQVNNGSSDNCGVVSLQLSQTQFDCSHVGVNEVLFTATDASGNSSNTAIQVTVVDSTPPVVLTHNLSIDLDANGTATINATDIDNGSSDACGIASLTVTPTQFNCDNVGDNIVTLTAVDVNGNSSSSTANVAVTDTLPPIVFATDIVLVLNDQGIASLAAEQVDNGSTDNCSISSLSLSQTSYSCHDLGENIVQLSAQDIHGNIGITTFTVTVLDTTSPFLTCVSDITLVANEQCSAVTPDILQTISDNCDTAPSIVQTPSAGTILGLGTHTVSVSATDSSGNTSTCVTTITVVDQSAPILSCVTPAVVHADENCQGTIPAIDYTVDDHCDAAVVVTQSPAAGQTLPPGEYSVVLTAVDASGNSAQCGVLVTIIDSTAPEIISLDGPSVPVEINTEITMLATALDACGIVSSEWHWGDDTSDPGYLIEETGEFTAFHTYSAPGVYTVELVVADEAGNVASQLFQYVVVYDPEGGFVTGGGWIQSPEGAYTANLTMSGKANFGFVAKYKKGASTPSGHTEFNFKAGGLNFKSTSYEWLVVAGANAKYKGVGSINGEDGFGFMLTATDGDLHGNIQPDAFRIKIWDQLTDEIVYDNKMGTADDATDAQTIGGGNIVIHP